MKTKDLVYVGVIGYLAFLLMKKKPASQVNKGTSVTGSAPSSANLPKGGLDLGQNMDLPNLTPTPANGMPTEVALNINNVTPLIKGDNEPTQVFGNYNLPPAYGASTINTNPLNVTIPIQTTLPVNTPVVLSPTPVLISTNPRPTGTSTVTTPLVIEEITTPRPTGTTNVTVPRPTTTVTVPRPTGTSTVTTPLVIEEITTPRPSATVTAPRPTGTTTVTVPTPTTTVTVPRPTTTVTAPRPTGTTNVTTPRPTSTVTTPRPTSTVTVPRPSATAVSTVREPTVVLSKVIQPSKEQLVLECGKSFSIPNNDKEGTISNYFIDGINFFTQTTGSLMTTVPSKISSEAFAEACRKFQIYQKTKKV